ncbi:MAG: hypothetical protein IPH64_15905 [Comamonadaceae bacterium]|mgnify:FL=1|jgi:SRSO17 transposase|nr:hypothetical protein [Comamonadaceae bacterium]HPL80432.1 transposase [Burkholderiaceae bacterium]
MLAGLVFGAGAGRSRALQISTADWADPPTAAAAGAPRAARVDPLHATARHKTLHHFVAKVQWSDWQLFHCVRQCVVALKDFCAGALRIIDDAGFPK